MENASSDSDSDPDLIEISLRWALTGELLALFCAKTSDSLYDLHQFAVELAGAVRALEGRLRLIFHGCVLPRSKTLADVGLQDGVEIDVLFAPWPSAFAGTSDGSIVVWATSTGEQSMLAERGHDGAITCLTCVLGCPTVLFSASSDGTAKRWNLETGECTMTYVSGGVVNAIDASVLGSLVVTGSSDGFAHIFEDDGQPCQKPLLALSHAGASVQSVACSQNGRVVLTGSLDHRARLWSAESGECLHIFAGHSGGVQAVALSLDVAYSATASSDESV